MDFSATTVVTLIRVKSIRKKTTIPFKGAPDFRNYERRSIIFSLGILDW